MRSKTPAAVRLLLPLLLVGAALVGTSAPSHAVNICGVLDYVTYYANSNDTDQVGFCEVYCAGGESCSGTKTQYSTSRPGMCYAC